MWCTTGLQSQLLELANGSCAAFVESADCVRRVHEKMTRIANHLARLEAALPAVGAEASFILASYDPNPSPNPNPNHGTSLALASH